MKILRIIFTLLCAVCLLAVFPIGTFFDFGYAMIVLLFAGVFFLGMLFCKNRQERNEAKGENSEPDFLNPAEDEKKE